MAKQDITYTLAKSFAPFRLAQINEAMQKLQEEEASIHATFPDVRIAQEHASEPASALVEATRVSSPVMVKRTRKPLSAAQRKAISARMGKYWAERRKAKKTSEK